VPVRTPLYLVSGFVSEANIPLNVTFIVGTLNNPANTNEVYLNISTVYLHQLLTAYDDPEGTNELALEFPWSVPQDLPSYPFPMQLIVTVYYMSADGRNQPYASVLYNNTVYMVAKSEAANLTGFLPTAVTLLGMVLFAVLFPAAFPDTAALFVRPSAAPSEAKVKKETRVAAEEDEYEDIIPKGNSHTTTRLRGAK
jgi:hypothetical protein